jgi:hypothetical protein
MARKTTQSGSSRARSASAAPKSAEGIVAVESSRSKTPEQRAEYEARRIKHAELRAAGKIKDAPAPEPTEAQARGAYKEYIPSLTSNRGKGARAKGDDK